MEPRHGMRRYGDGPPRRHHDGQAARQVGESMRELVEYIAKNLVETPEGVRVEQFRGNQPDMVVLRLFVPEAERGKVIGREGRIAKAMRDLLRVGAARYGRRALLEIR